MPQRGGNGKGKIYNSPSGTGSGSRGAPPVGKMCKAGRGPTVAGAIPALHTEEVMSHVMGWTVGAVLAAAGVGVPVWWVTSSHPARTEPEKPQLPVMDTPEDPPKKTEFATGGADDKVAEVKFDSDRALKYLKQLCDIGPRISGSEGMKKQQEVIEAHFKKL